MFSCFCGRFLLKIKFLNIVLFWSFFAVFMTGVMTLVHPITNRPVSVWGEFVWEMAFSFVWIIGTPIALWIARKYSVQKSDHVKNGVILFGAGMVLSTLQCIIHGLIIYLLHPDAKTFEINIILNSLFYNIDKMLIVYCALVIMQHAMDFYQRYQEKELTASKLETQLSQAQMLALKMQLQPHFLFNTLNAIVTLVHKDPILAEEMIVRLSDFLRITLDASGKQIVSLKEELDFIKSYLLIEEIRFSGRLSYEENVPSELFDAQIPMLLLQPLVENSIKHGFSQYEHAKILNISAETSNGSLIITVTDDAVPSEKLVNIQEGIGLTNSRQRLQALYGDKALMTISPNKINGVTVRLKIPHSTENE